MTIREGDYPDWLRMSHAKISSDAISGRQCHIELESPLWQRGFVLYPLIWTDTITSRDKELDNWSKEGKRMPKATSLTGKRLG
jgi:hypothetical protein